MLVNKVLTWGVIVMLLLSQSYAFGSVPCGSIDDASSQHNHHMANSLIEHDMPKHMQHPMPQPQLVMDCCDQDCSCPTGTCASATLSHIVSVNTVILVSQASGFYLFSIADPFLPSLPKPPIIG